MLSVLMPKPVLEESPQTRVSSLQALLAFLRCTLHPCVGFDDSDGRMMVGAAGQALDCSFRMQPDGRMPTVDRELALADALHDRWRRAILIPAVAIS